MDQQIRNAAYDQNIIGINPDYQIKVRKDILERNRRPHAEIWDSVFG